MSDAIVRIRALVLSRTHHCLLVRTEDGPGVPEYAGLAPARPLEALRRHVHATVGLALPSPAGSFVPADGRGPRDFVFVIDPPVLPAGHALTWAPIAQAVELTRPAGHDAFLWTAYVECMLGGWEPPARAIDVFSFGNSPEMAAKLAHLCISGNKRGTACWVRGEELTGNKLPERGLVSICTDGFGYPRCAIRTEDVRTLRFADTDAPIAELEGEGDLTLADWREGHLAFFRSEADSLRTSFNEDEELLVERFRVLHVIGRSDSSG